MTSIKNLSQNLEFGRYSIGPAIEAARSCQDLEVEMNSEDRIVAVAHASGAQARFNSSYVVVRTIDGTLWLGSSLGAWHPLD